MQLRDYLPKTLFWRMLSIILIPMILVQVITVFIFYERHWDTVTRHMAEQLAADISLLADRTGAAPDEATIALVQETGWQYFVFPVQFYADAEWTQPANQPPQSSLSDWHFLLALTLVHTDTHMQKPTPTHIYNHINTHTHTASA